MFSIYIITNDVNGKRYVGQTIKPVAIRFSQHVSVSRPGVRGSALHRAIAKYGRAAFTVSTIATCETKVRADELECAWIGFTRSDSRDVGYNLTEGGGGIVGLVHTPESRAKMSAARKGKPHTAEHRARIGAAHRGKVVPRDVVERSAAAKRGSKHTAEAKAKISAGGFRRWAAVRAAKDAVH